MRIIYYKLAIYILLSYAHLSVAQNELEVPTAAADVKTFALNPEQIGGIANSVNLSTGDVNLPLNLISLPSHNGLSINVSIAYTSNVQHIVNTWNLEAPTGILGLGWDMDFPKIITDHKQTGAKADDEYYLKEGGGTNRLIRTISGDGTNGIYYIYEAKNYQFWKIKYYPYWYDQTKGIVKYDLWEIIKEDGTKYVYGDTNSNRNTVQWIVHWDNWIGNSGNIEGQEQMPYIWNLSEIINIWGERITYEYVNDENRIGGILGKFQTEASYLKRIIDPLGRKVEFSYKLKEKEISSTEKIYYYQEPHTETPEPDGYQEFYEKKYLDFIEVFRENGLKLFNVKFTYTDINTGNMAKLLLSSIVQKNSTGDALPGMEFKYVQSGVTKGFMQEVVLPTKGTISYTYKTEGNELFHTNRERIIAAPEGYGEQRIWSSEDYIVITWRKLKPDGSHEENNGMPVVVSAYQWDGGWREQYIDRYDNIFLETGIDGLKYYKNFQVTLQKDFFAIMVPETNTPGKNRYLHVYHKDRSLGYLWRSNGWRIDVGGINPALNTPWLMSGNNFLGVGRHGYGSILTYVYQGNSWREEILSQPAGAYYGTGTNNYIINHNDNKSGGDLLYFHHLGEDKKWTSRQIFDIPFNSDGVNYWHSTNSFALIMANKSSEYIYQWSKDYTNIQASDDIIGAYPDDSYVYLLNNSLINLVPRLGNITAKSLRFDGKVWASTSMTSFLPSKLSFGSDFNIWLPNIESDPQPGYLRFYNPISSTWESNNEDYSFYDNTDLFYENFGSYVGKVGKDVFIFSDKLYFRNPDGTWHIGYTLQRPSTGPIDARSFKIGNDFFVYATGINFPERTYLYSIKNGGVGGLLGMIPTYYSNMNSPISNNVIVYGHTSWDGGPLTIHKIINDGFTGNQIDYPVTVVTSFDGVNNIKTLIDYVFSKATIDPSGTVARYNEVNLIPGSDDAINKPYGYTKMFFYNGLSGNELGGSAGYPYLHLNGLSYKSIIFDSNGNQVSETKTGYLTRNKILNNNIEQKVDYGFYVRPTSITNKINGVETVTNQNFDDNTGLLVNSDIYINNIESVSKHIFVEYKYFWQQYDPTRDKNILTPVIQTKKSLTDNFGGQVIDVSATTWKQWNNIYAPHKSYLWEKTGSSDFDFNAGSDGNEPTNNWQKTSQIDFRDPTGKVLQTTIF